MGQYIFGLSNIGPTALVPTLPLFIFGPTRLARKILTGHKDWKGEIVSSGQYHWTHCDADTCPLLDTCQYLIISSGNWPLDTSQTQNWIFTPQNVLAKNFHLHFQLWSPAWHWVNIKQFPLYLIRSWGKLKRHKPTKKNKLRIHMNTNILSFKISKLDTMWPITDACKHSDYNQLRL